MADLAVVDSPHQVLEELQLQGRVMQAVLVEELLALIEQVVVAVARELLEVRVVQVREAMEVMVSLIQ
jgi:hypothetical protein